MDSTPKYSITTVFTDLPPSEQEFVFRETEQRKPSQELLELFARRRMFLGLKEDSKLLAFFAYSLKDGRCIIERVWGRAPKNFITEYKTTPATFLWEELLRKRFRVFVVRGTTTKGNLFFSKKISTGLLKKAKIPELALGFRATQSAIKLAKLRKKI